MPSYIGPSWEAIYIVRKSLLNVVEKELKTVYGESGWWDRVATRFSKERQLQLKELFESRRKNILAPLKGEEKELLDLSDLHKIIEGEWSKVFKQAWPKSPLNWLQEIIDVRNPLAHPTSEGIKKDVAVRLIQNAILILSGVDEQATTDLRSLQNDLDDIAKDVSLRPWYASATPHQDIREGRLDEAVFAADLWAVVQGTSADVYKDPEQFFLKTHMTGGLKTVLKRVASALSGRTDSGDRIISLQTVFGGGKTHILIALYHLAKHTEQVRRLCGEGELKDALSKLLAPPKSVAVFTNKTCDIVQGRVTAEGIHTRTIWGDLAAQLGGKELYRLIQPNDESRTVPQGIFVKVLEKAAPCLILIDELADYCTGAAAVTIGNSTLADQTVSFMQQLSEAVQQVPGSVLIATLPASKYEVAQSEKGQEIFSALEKRYGRIAADIKPVADEEIYEVIRTRLFESITTPTMPEYYKKVATAYQKMYSDHSNELPSDATKGNYREQMERSYPFHPLLIDILYTRWGSHSDFQRTRGVLRLLGSIIGDLWQRRDSNTQSQHLIQPCHIRWSIDAMQAALTRLWGQGFQSVVAADVFGEKANARLIDEELRGDYDREKIAQGLAAAILLGSFGGKGERSGLSSRDLKLACSRYALNWNYSDGALTYLDDRSHYLRTVSAGSYGKRYWYSTKPNLNRLLLKYRQQAERQAFDHEIIELLRESVRREPSGEATWRIVVDPGKDLAEQKGLALILLPPALSFPDEPIVQDTVKDQVKAISLKCGTKDRIYRNTLLFLGQSVRGLNKLYQAFRERYALKNVHSDYSDQLDPDQLSDLSNRLQSAEKTLIESLGPAHTVLFRISDQTVEVLSLTDSRNNLSEHLKYIWNELLDNQEWITKKIGSVTLRESGLIPESAGISVKDAVEAFLRYTDKPMVSDRLAVTGGLERACQDGLIGIGRGVSLSNLVTKYCRQAVHVEPSEEGVWIIPAFQAEPVGVGITPGPSEISVPGQESHVTEGAEPTAVKEAQKKRIRKFIVRGSVAMENYSELFRCFISPAARMNLKKLDLGVEFEMETFPDKAVNEDDSAIKAMKEAAKQLGLSFEIEE